MSLLDRELEDVTVYLEEVTTDSDGNTLTRPSTTGIPARAAFSVAAASGTSARRAEQDNEGFESETSYRMRFPRSFPYVLEAQSRVLWRGKYWAVIGDPQIHYMGSSLIDHTYYMIRRS